MSVLSRLLGRKGETAKKAEALFQSINAQSRNAAFYQTGRVPDTFDGRFEVFALHASLVLERLKRDGPEGMQVAVKLHKKMYDIFEYALREDGAGDMTIAKKMRRLAESFEGRLKSYSNAADNEEMWSDALGRNVLSGASNLFLPPLTAYALDARKRLANIDEERLISSAIEWPELV